MAPARDLSEYWRCRRHLERAAPVGEEAALVAGQNMTGEAEGERRLADAARPRDQPSMVQPARLPGAQQGLLGERVADEVSIGAGRRRAGLGRISHRGSSLTEAAEEFRLDVRLNGLDGPAGIDEGAALRILARDRQEAVAQAIVEVDGHLLVAVLVAGARRRPLQALLDRKIEDQGEIGRGVADHRLEQGLDDVEWDAVAVALVGRRRVGEAVADHP